MKKPVISLFPRKKYVILLFLCLISLKAHTQVIKKKIKKNLTTVYNSNFLSIADDYIFTFDVDGKIIDSTNIYSDFDISSYKLLNKNFLINPMGGELFSLNKGKINKIDNSYTHKNQLLSSIFILNDTLFRFGGYGFFDARNFITFFSSKTLEWEVMKTNSKKFPAGTFDSKFFINNNSLFIIGGYGIDPNDRTKNISINEIWKFSFVKKSWSKIAEHSFITNLRYHSLDFVYNNEFYFANENKLYKYEILKNSISDLGNFVPLEKGGEIFPTIISNDTIYNIGTAPNLENFNNYIYNTPINQLKVKNQIQLSNDLTSNIKFLIFLFLSIIIIIFILKSVLKKKALELKNNKVYYGSKSFDLNKIEYLFLNTLLNNQNVENINLISLINSNVDSSQKSRIKNKTIESLNLKLTHLTKKSKKIVKIKSNDDKRYYSYILKERH